MKKSELIDQENDENYIDNWYGNKDKHHQPIINCEFFRFEQGITSFD